MRKNNPKISDRANESLAKREAVVMLQKKLILIVSIIVVSLILLLGSTVIIFAKTNDEKQTIVTEYVSIQVQSGDTLWSIAETHTNGYDVAVSDYIESVKVMNNLNSDSIHSGEYLIVPTYRFDAK